RQHHKTPSITSKGPSVLLHLAMRSRTKRESVFSIRGKNVRAAAAKAGIDLPERQAFHIFCRTYATMLRRYGKLDLRGLVATGRWKDIKSTIRYTHTIASEEAQRASLLPAIELPRNIRRK